MGRDFGIFSSRTLIAVLALATIGVVALACLGLWGAWEIGAALGRLW